MAEYLRERIDVSGHAILNALKSGQSLLDYYQPFAQQMRHHHRWQRFTQRLTGIRKVLIRLGQASDLHEYVQDVESHNTEHLRTLKFRGCQTTTAFSWILFVVESLQSDLASCVGDADEDERVSFCENLHDRLTEYDPAIVSSVITIAIAEALRTNVGPRRVIQWDADRLELSLNNHIIGKFGAQVGKAIRVILGSFEDDEWPEMIDDPTTDREMRKGALRTLNKKCSEVHFYTYGDQIGWKTTG